VAITTNGWALDTRFEKMGSFLVITDIHFDPFYTCTLKHIPCPIIDKLHKAPVSEWKEIFAKNDIKKPVYGKDTNMVLFEATAHELKKRAEKQKVKFVLILGDFLGHHFTESYRYYTGDSSIEGIRRFVDKTLQFMTTELTKSLATTDIYMAVGNNDSYAGDYVSQPIFYKNMAVIWGQGIINKENRLSMEKAFAEGGYYAMDIPNQKNLRLIMLNSTYFAKGKGLGVPAEHELTWLHHELSQLHRRHQKAIIALHIPVGIDVYKTVNTHKVVSLWNPSDSQRFLQELKEHADEIIAIFSGHLHADSFQIIRADTKQIPALGNPAISPLFGDNPGYKVYRYSLRSLAIKNYLTYYYPLNESSPQWQLAYEFNKVYQGKPFSDIVVGMNTLCETGKLAEHYKKYYMLGRDVQPITTENKWLPYYWCAIRNVTTADYETCVEE
jgi:sphingomyelin phosphodiesterase acid-like 3